MERIEQRSGKHQRVAQIDVEPDEAGRGAVGGDVDDAVNGEGHAHDVERRSADAEDQEIAHHHQNRDGGLDHGDVDGGGKIGRAIEQGVEAGETDDAVKGQPPHATPDFRPFGTQGAPGEGKDDEEGHNPAQGRKLERIELADGVFARDDIGAPEQRREREQQVGLVHYACEAIGRRLNGLGGLCHNGPCAL